MATKEIKNRIVLEGEKEYSAALKEANRNLKTLKSELKAETAELGRNATEQQKNETRLRTLKKQIAEQEKIVRTYEKALAEVREKYADNADAIATYEQRLNNARATLADFKNDLDGIGESFEGVGKSSEMAVVATTSIAESLEKIGGAGDAVAGAIEDIFTGMISTVRDAVGELWDLISSTAAKANQWTDIAGYWGTDAQTIQQYARAVASTSNSFEDLQSAISKIALGDRDKIEELLNFHVEGDMSDWDYAIQVMKQLSGLSGQERNNALEQIFGERRATKVMDLLNDWGSIQELLGQFNGDESGYGMTTGMLSTMNDLEVKISTVQEKLQALRERIAGGLGEAAMTLTINAEGVLDGFADYLNAEDDAGREEALNKIRENAEAFFRGVGEAIKAAIGVLDEVAEELKGSDDPVVAAVGGILDGLTNGLQWVIDNQETVRNALLAIFGTWLVARIAAVGGQVAGLVLQLKAIAAFKGLGAAGAAAGAAGAAGKAAGGAAAGGGGNILSGFFGSSVARVTGGVAAGLGILFENAIKHQGNDDILTKEEEEAFEQEHADEIAWQRNKLAWNRAVEEAGFEPKEMEDVTKATDEQRIAAENFWDILRENPMDFSDAEFGAFEGAFAGSEGLFDKISAVMDLLMQQTDDDSWRSLEDLPGWLWTMDPSRWNEMGVSGSSGEGGLTSGDIQGFRSLPGQLQAAARAGTAAGVSGIRVELDGAAVGRMVAPEVSRIIAADILG